MISCFSWPNPDNLHQITLFATFLGRFPSLEWSDIVASLPFMAPSLLYVMSNNVYYYGITLVTPPIWAILISIKTTISALTYKVFLGHLWLTGFYHLRNTGWPCRFNTIFCWLWFGCSSVCPILLWQGKIGQMGKLDELPNWIYKIKPPWSPCRREWNISVRSEAPGDKRTDRRFAHYGIERACHQNLGPPVSDPNP